MVVFLNFFSVSVSEEGWSLPVLPVLLSVTLLLLSAEGGSGISRVCLMKMVNTAWERELSAFILVAAVWRLT